MGKIGSIIGVIIAIIGLNLSNTAFQTFHENPATAGIYVAIFIFGIVLAWVSVSPTQMQPYIQQQITAQQTQSKATLPKSKYATASLVFGFLSFIPMLGFLMGILAYVCGYISLKQIKEKNLAGKGMAISGILLAMFGMLFNISFISYIGRAGS